PREEEPQINVTMANVLIAFPGASSADVQNMVARPAEHVLSQIAGIEHTYSVSRPGMAVMTVQFEVGVPRTEALVRLYDVLNANQDWLPAGLGTLPPIVRPKGIDDVPVLAVTLWGREGTSGVELERVAHAMESELKRVPGTREVQTIGGPGRTVQVTLQPEKLRERGVDVLRLKQTLAAANQAMPAGTVIDDAGAGPTRSLVVETGEFLRSAADVEDLVVGVHQGKPVYLREVAKVEAGAAQPARYVWYTPGAGAAIAAAGQPAAPDPGAGYPAVTLTVTKKPGENAVDVARAARQRVEELRNTIIPAGIEATITRDSGATAAEKANKLIQKLGFATASVILLVGLALGRREAVIVGAAVILTLTATLFASWAWGFTLNRVSLFALIFSIGILVDDAIVVVENIHRHQLLDPTRPLKDIIPVAVDEVGGPTILATLTVIAALLPMAFVSGLMGPYLSPIPINASMGMLISLVVAFVFTPWMTNALLGRHHERHGHHAGSLDEGERPSVLSRLFRAVIGPFLAGAKGNLNRWLLLAGILVLIGGSVLLAVNRTVILKMLPFDNKSEFQVVLDRPEGTSLEQTARVLAEMGEFLETVPEVSDYQAYAGTAAPINFNGLVRQ
ncbi:MAG TPA: efflux RND transporter permease subunit, partial [Rubrivivax sp.]|nr:efflux RND transporter permease subunit [Rubrivivax sp.]